MYVGKNIPHDSARGHVSGSSRYIDDLPPLRGELWVELVWSPIARGRVRSIDLTDAARIEGVVVLLTARDIPGTNVFGPILEDEILLAEDEVHFIGHPLVVIGATSRKAALQAKALVRLEIEELEPVLTIGTAREYGLTIGQQRVIRRGDAEAALSRAPHRLDGVFECGGQDHFYLESQAALAIPGEFDTITIHSSTQNPSEVQEVVAHVLHLQINQVTVETRRMGGAFGGKECQATHPAALAALVAHKTKRPARLVYTKDDDMIITGKRHPFQNHWRVGFDDDGRILALEVELYSDGGAFADLSTAVMGRAMTHVDNSYWIPDIFISGQVCRTNNAPNTAFRGFGGPQGVATIEAIIEEIACALDRDAFDIRRINCYGVDERNVTPYGQIIANNTLPRLFDELLERSDYRARAAAVRSFNESARGELRGISMTAVKFGISFNTKFLNQANALVNVYLDGTVQVSTGATEMGQGVNTKIQQFVADEFGIPAASVRVMITSTDKNNNTSATAASSAADLNGAAAVDASRKIRARLAECAANELARRSSDTEASAGSIVFRDGQVWDERRPDTRVSFRDLVRIAHRQRLHLGEKGFYATPGVDYNADAGSGHPFLYYTNGCAVSEVLIDRYTGMMRLLRSDLLMDIGRPVNPGIDRGQITGAFVQGLGWCTTEELRYDGKGRLLTHSPTTYKIPGITDLPEVFNVDWIDNPSNSVNIRGSKAVGEPPLLLGISVWTAVKHALSFVSHEASAALRLPATNEEIVMQLAAVEGKVAAS
jgi:xanthine dehydrogenase large subunit